MKTLSFVLFTVCVLISCKKRGISPTELSNLALGPVWKTYEYSKNGVGDAAVLNRRPTFEFRLDSKLYMTRISPAFADTFAFQFLNDYNIKASKPTINSQPVTNFKIDKIDDTSFHFTITRNNSVDVEVYKTSK